MSKVLVFTDMMTSAGIYTDNGHYEGTILELNVRKLGLVQKLENISIMNDYARAITESVEGYGCGWGDTSKLYPVTDEQVDKLIKLNEEIGAERKAREEAQYKADAERTERLIKSGLCPKCGTWCYGSCGVAK
jgi:hypothetical protein